MDPDTAYAIYRRLLLHYPIVEGRTNFIPFDSPFESLILTILSAQTTDRSVTAVREPLFSRYPTPEALAAASPEEVEPIIRTLGFHHAKAEYIVGTARKIVESFGGEVPRTMNELRSLPGVGRKTANIVLSHAFGINTGIAVDTHVRRVSHRLGMTESRNPDIIERDLMALLPEETWGEVNYLLIRHGREICTARNPKHEECFLRDLCRYYREEVKRAL